MRLPSTNVTVPVAATLKSPLRRTAPIASPGWNSADVVELPSASLRAGAVVPLVVDPLGTATKPIASRYFAKPKIVSYPKLASERGTAIGFTPDVELAGTALS